MRFVGIFFVLVAFVIAGAMTSGITTEARAGIVQPAAATPTATPTPSAEQEPQYSSYRGISIKTPAAQVAEKLGEPKGRSKAGDYFVLSPTETAQISYDNDQTVKSISVNFTGDLKSAPTPKDVVGVDVKKESDGSISKMVSFPKSGYWVSYIRTAGKDATIIITLQKLAVD